MNCEPTERPSDEREAGSEGVQSGRGRSLRSHLRLSWLLPGEAQHQAGAADCEGQPGGGEAQRGEGQAQSGSNDHNDQHLQEQTDEDQGGHAVGDGEVEPAEAEGGETAGREAEGEHGAGEQEGGGETEREGADCKTCQY